MFRLLAITIVPKQLFFSSQQTKLTRLSERVCFSAKESPLRNIRVPSTFRFVRHGVNGVKGQGVDGGGHSVAVLEVVGFIAIVETWRKNTE